MAIAGDNGVELSVLSMDEPSVCSTEANSILDEGIEYRLEIERRAADDLEDLARGCLLLQSLGHLRVRLG